MTTDENQLQILDEFQQFSSLLPTYMKTHWNLDKAGFDYNLVAVFGSQSTGKSTLLNKLFSTDFACMSNESRRQTTKGLWINKAKDLPLLVMDVEGTDGRERGEDQDFERKSALFSVATAEIIIVNMWENMVGLYNGANMGLLKVVFEVNLQLFHATGSPKSLLLFVIRDFTGTTPLSALSLTLKADLEKIWAGLNKPAGKESSDITDFFDFSFAALPHKLYAADMFDKAVDVLRERFSNRENPGYVFQQNYKKNIPADGFARFAETIWEKIVSNRDLDIPSQQQLLAQYRCEEIARAVFESFADPMRDLQDRIDGGAIIEKLGELLDSMKSDILDNFDQDASRYNKSVYNQKRNDFITKIEISVKGLFLQQMRNLYKRSMTEYTKHVNEKLSGGEADFMTQLTSITASSIASFTEIAESSKITGSNWSSTEAQSEFSESVALYADKRKDDAFQNIIQVLQKRVKTALVEPVQVQLSLCSPELWMICVEIYRDAVIRSITEVSAISCRFELSADELEKTLFELKQESLKIFVKTVRDECGESQMMSRLRKAFETVFKYDSKGNPRLWNASDNMEQLFADGKVQVDKILNCFARIDVPLDTFVELIDEESLVLLSPLNKAALAERFKRESDTLFIEAKRSIVATNAHIPMWFVGLTIVLGWNEFWAVITNPVYFLIIGLMFLSAFGVWYLGLTNPVLAITRAASKEVGRQLGDGFEGARQRVSEVMSPPRKDKVDEIELKKRE